MGIDGILIKRIPRKLKAKWPRYLALFAMVTLSVYVFLGMMASSYSVINGVLASDQEHGLESGQFSAIEPLSDEELAHLQDMGVQVEAAFSQDFTQEDGTLLRVYTVRQGIDTIALEKGALPAADGELVLEQSYARVHGIQPGDSVQIAGMPFTVAGTGSTPDFESPRKSLTNPASDTTTFGLVYVTPSAYQALLDTGMADRAQELLYHYRLGEGVTDADVNEYVGSLLFDSLKAQDDFVRDTAVTETAQVREMKAGIQKLVDGSGQLSSALKQLNAGIGKLNDGADRLYGGNAQAAEGGRILEEKTTLIYEQAQELVGAVEESGFKIDASTKKILVQIRNNLDSYYNGVKTLSSGLKELEAGSSQLAAGEQQAYDASKLILAGMKKLERGIQQLQAETDRIIDQMVDTKLTKVVTFTTAVQNSNIEVAVGNQRIMWNLGIVLGLVILFVLAYVISVFVINAIDSERSVIGAMYALGVSRRQVMCNYLALPAAVALAGGIAGTAVGLSPIGTGFQMYHTLLSHSLPSMPQLCPPGLILAGVLVPPLVVVLVNALVIRKKLDQPVLHLLKNMDAQRNGVDIPALEKLPFEHRFEIRHVIREFRSVFTVGLGVFGSLLLVMLGLNAYAMCNNLIKAAQDETTFQYQYVVKYPPSELPAGATAYYAESLTKPLGETTHTITLLGVEDNGAPYFDVAVEHGKNKVVISSALASKWGLHEGDKLVLSNDIAGLDYGFTVSGIAEYKSGFYAFMDASSMRALFDRKAGYYNVLMSQEPLDLETPRIYSMTTYDDVMSATQQFYDIFRTRLFLLICVPVVLFAIIMYLMLTLIVDRATTGISLLKIFGYPDKTVRRMYLHANGMMVLVDVIVLIPVTKLIMDAAFPTLMASASIACDLTLPWWIYGLILAGVLVVYIGVNLLLMRKFNRITPAVALKNRD